jgi:medium-chain acyl-[acyl-carrier-protein] hydrolase
MPPLIEALGGSIASYLDKPFLFFGHSMGALVSFELARFLRSHYHQLPDHLFLSARCDPQVVDPNADNYLLPQHSFLEAVEDLYGALPDIVKEDPEVLELFLSILRADLTVLGTYAYVHEPPLDCPISVYAGSHDHSVSEANLETWRKQTSAAFDLRIFPGSHSFIQNSRAGIINDIHRHLSSYLNY